MSDIDWVILTIVLLSGLISLWRGFVKEALSLVSWFTAIIISFTFSSALSSLLSNLISNELIRWIAAFLILFIGTLLVIGLINHLLASLLQKSGLGVIDRVLGMAFGMMRGGVIVLVILMLLPLALSVETQAWWQESVLIPKFLLLEDWALATFSDLAQWRREMISGQ